MIQETTIKIVKIPEKRKLLSVIVDKVLKSQLPKNYMYQGLLWKHYIQQIFVYESGARFKYIIATIEKLKLHIVS